MKILYFILAIPVFGLIGVTIMQPSEAEIEAALNVAHDYLGNFSDQIEFDQKVKKFAPQVAENAREMGEFVSGPAWFKRDKSRTVRNVLTTGSLRTT